MSLRSRFIGAMRRGQNLSLAGSPMDTLLKRPTRVASASGPEGTEKKPIVFRSRGVMQRSQIV
ncbi:MAG: hypothetical protein R6T98_07500 [Desulfatiglandales bacterium]